MMKTYIIASAIITALIVSCDATNNITKLVDEAELAPKDSLDEMLKVIAMVDSAHVVEDISDKYVAMREENEQLQEELIETKQELEITVQHLEKAKEIITANSFNDTIKSEFELLPISKANGN